MALRQPRLRRAARLVPAAAPSLAARLPRRWRLRRTPAPATSPAPLPESPPQIRTTATCIPADDPRICPPGCTGHAAACPDRQGDGLVFREIKERRRKTVALPPELVAVLKAQREAQDLERETAANLWHDHGVVLACEDGRLIDPSADLREWSAILAQAGIPHAGTHTMRHSAATIALDEGIAPAVVQEMLGHSDIRLTRGYTHVSSLLA